VAAEVAKEKKNMRIAVKCTHSVNKTLKIMVFRGSTVSVDAVFLN